MSAVATFAAIGTFHTAAIRSSALTSGSCGCGSSGSQKKISMSMTPSAIFAPICWSPPTGPDSSRVTGRPSSNSSMVPVVPVAYRWCRDSVPRLNSAQRSSSTFLLSCATRAMWWATPGMGRSFRAVVPWAGNRRRRGARATP